MKCGKCPYSTVDFDDDEDGYYCPFELRSRQPYMFFSGRECTHEQERMRNDRFKFGHEISPGRTPEEKDENPFPYVEEWR